MTGCAPVPATSGAAATALPDGRPHGSFAPLRLQDITITLTHGPVVLRLIPLDTAVLRYVDSATAARLRDVAAAAAPVSGSETSAGSRFLVSAFSREGGAAYDLRALRVVQHGRAYRVTDVEAVSGAFENGILETEAAEMGVVRLDGTMDATAAFAVEYYDARMEWQLEVRADYPGDQSGMSYSFSLR